MRISRKKEYGLISAQQADFGGVYRVIDSLNKMGNIKIYSNKSIIKKNKLVNLLHSLIYFLKIRPAEDKLIFLTPNSIFLNIFYKRKAIYYINGLSYGHYKKPRLLEILIFYFWIRYLKSIKKNCIILTNSRYTQQRLLSLTGIHSQVLYPPVECKMFRIGSDKGYFFANGRFVNYKNFEELIKTFGRLKNLKLVLAGAGPLLPNYLETIKQNKIENVKIISRPSQKKLALLYSNCTAVIFPSIEEHFGLVPIEALASGKIPICHNSGGPKEYIKKDINGILFNSFQELESILTEFSSKKFDKTLLVRFSKKFDTSEFIKNFIKLTKI